MAYRGVVKSSELALPHPDFPLADWADSYSVDVARDNLEAIDVARILFSRAPRWVGMLLDMRNRVMAVLGFKVAELKMTERETVGGFPLVEQGPDKVILGFDDGHLDFRILLALSPTENALTRVTLTTLVQRHNIFGRLYILVITPFHKLIVKTLLQRVTKQGVFSPPPA